MGLMKIETWSKKLVEMVETSVRANREVETEVETGGNGHTLVETCRRKT